jgi:hypothetical protein
VKFCFFAAEKGRHSLTRFAPLSARDARMASPTGVGTDETGSGAHD